MSLGIDMVSSIPDKKNIVVLLSDGVHNSGFITPDEAIEYAKMNNVQIHTIGLGSEEPVFLRNDVYGEPQYVELDEQTLKKISDETNGKYFKSVDEQTLKEIFTLLSSNLEYQMEWSSISQWFIGAAMALLLADVYIIYGRYRIAA